MSQKLSDMGETERSGVRSFEEHKRRGCSRQQQGSASKME